MVSNVFSGLKINFAGNSTSIHFRSTTARNSLVLIGNMTKEIRLVIRSIIAYFFLSMFMRDDPTFALFMYHRSEVTLFTFEVDAYRIDLFSYSYFVLKTLFEKYYQQIISVFMFGC